MKEKQRKYLYFFQTVVVIAINYSTYRNRNLGIYILFPRHRKQIPKSNTRGHRLVCE
jgi:hypothetical protein